MLLGLYMEGRRDIEGDCEMKGMGNVDTIFDKVVMVMVRDISRGASDKKDCHYSIVGV